MKIVNKKKFVVRILEILVIIGTIILTILSINYANKLRGYQAYGGEYLIPVLGLLIILVIETTYEESENKKDEKRRTNKRRN
jgi:cytochrome c biogenesis protein CcdA